ALRVRETLTTVASWEIEVELRNTGARAGTEVVQLCLRDEAARVARPDRQLVGFTGVNLAPGESTTVRFMVDPSALAYYDEDMRLVIEPGATRVMVGGLEQSITVTGTEREIAPNDRRPATVTII